MSNRNQPKEFTTNVKKGKNGSENLSMLNTPNVNLVKKQVGPVATKKPFDYKKQSKEIDAMVSGIKSDTAYLRSGIYGTDSGSVLDRQMMKVGRKLRDIGNEDCGCGPAGRDTGHMERTNINVYNHIESLRQADMENQIKKIDQRVNSGQISNKVGKYLKKNLK